LGCNVGCNIACNMGCNIGWSVIWGIMWIVISGWDAILDGVPYRMVFRIGCNVGCGSKVKRYLGWGGE
jgi:hypothetical protein